MNIPENTSNPKKARVVSKTLTRKETLAGVPVKARIPGWQVADRDRRQGSMERAVVTATQHPVALWVFLVLAILGLLSSLGITARNVPDTYVWGVFAAHLAICIFGVLVFDDWAERGPEKYMLPADNFYIDSEDANRIANLMSDLPESGRARRKAIRAVSDEVKKINTANEKRITAEVERQYAHALTATQPAITTPGLSWDGAVRIHDTVKQEYGEFLSNPLEVVSMPLLADGELSDKTRKFERSLVVADDAKRSGDTTRYGQVVLDLSEAWDDAQAYAQRHGADTLPAKSQVALRRAKKLLAQALDDATPPHVAAAAVRQAEQLLRGVMSLPAITRGMLENAVRAELLTQPLVETKTDDKLEGVV